MDVFDSNIWIFGCLFPDSEPRRLVREVARDEPDGRNVWVPAYVFNEVIERFQAPKGRYDAQHVRRAEAYFSDIVSQSRNVRLPRQEEIETMDPQEEMNRPANELLAEILDIQSKDAPVLTGAWSRNRHVDLYTCDRSFSDCDLSAFGIDYLPIQYVRPPA